MKAPDCELHAKCIDIICVSAHYCVCVFVCVLWYCALCVSFVLAIECTVSCQICHCHEFQKPSLKFDVLTC